jgi:hypothetical protein
MFRRPVASGYVHLRGTRGGHRDTLNRATIAAGLRPRLGRVRQRIVGFARQARHAATTRPGPSLGADGVGVSVRQGASAVSRVVAVANDGGGTVKFSTATDAPWLRLEPSHLESRPTLTVRLDPTGLAPGCYTTTVIGQAGRRREVASLSVWLWVEARLEPFRIHLAWVEAPASTLTFIWHTRDDRTPSVINYRVAGEPEWQTGSAPARRFGRDSVIHEVTIRSLLADTCYEYRLGGDHGASSPTYAAHTAPVPGPADFDAVFVADTGIAQRADGLAAGTRRVVEEIAAFHPRFLLAGGDLAYANTDPRFGTVAEAIDAWIDQMQPVATQCPLLPTYGNHEALLGEGLDDWIARFPTPVGFDRRRNYSFDVGDAHFVAILAVTRDRRLSKATEEWIDRDIRSARARGSIWVIPYLHVSPFSDGEIHPSNLALRTQLAPIFEELGVNVVFSAHDQSYERTLPLRGVPNQIEVTSTDPCRYTKADGVSWVKVSPGGKLSSRNHGFSPFVTEPAPPYVACRDNTLHHFARIRITAAGDLRVDAFGLAGDDSPPKLVDHFEYTAN